MKESIKIFLATAVVSASAFYGIYRLLSNEQTSFYEGKNLKAIIQVDKLDSPGTRMTGYHYDLLKRFAASMGASVEINHTRPKSNPLDSLLAGTADIVVIPAEHTHGHDSIHFSQKIGGAVVWAVKTDDPRRHEDLSEWMRDYVDSETDDSIRTVFLTPLHPHRLAQNGVRRSQLTPYDDILKANADSIGWDWRMLAALMYQESRFNINAGSGRGARGLMQLMPVTRRNFGCENYLDPEENIMAGARLIAFLEEKFRSKAADEGELERITLAAYNAGDGRISQCFATADSLGTDTKVWDSLVRLIPPETVSFVKNVLSYYDCFKEICPDTD